MRPTLLIPLFCFPLSLFAQPYTPKYLPIGDRSPYDPNWSYHTWSLKGKVLPFLFGNGGGVSGMLGVEYGFAKNQSIGVDGFYEYQENSNDNVQDTAGVTHDFGDYYHSNERAIFLNYRYYFNCAQLRKDGIIPYILVFGRYGKLDQHYDPLYPLSSFKDNYETHRSVGLMLGSAFQFNRPRRLGLDINLGIFEKKKDISAVYLKNGVTSTVDSHPLGPGFRLSVNLVYWFYFRVFTPPTNSTSRPAQ